MIIMLGNLGKTIAASLLGSLIVGCAGAAEPTAPPPNIEATVQARVAATAEALPTITTEPFATPIPDTATTEPTLTPTAEPTATPTPTPAPTPMPTLAPFPAVLATPSPTPDIAEFVEYLEWLSPFADGIVFNLEHFNHRFANPEPLDPYWRSRMEEIALNFIDGHKEAAGINPPPLFEASHTKFVEGQASFAAFGRLLRSWLNSEGAVTEQTLTAWLQMLEDGQRLMNESVELIPVIDGYEAIKVDDSGTITLEGRGQQASLKFHLNQGLAIFRMTHNGGGHFSMSLLDNRGESLELLVNEIGAFNGSKAVQIRETGIYLLDISADGSWTVKIEQ